MTWLAILAVVCAVLGAFYYLRVIRAMFFEEAEGAGPQINGDSHLRAVFAINAAALLVLGLFADPIMAWCRLAFPV
jgi:NADH-quinone oxidoreductase subunit N